MPTLAEFYARQIVEAKLSSFPEDEFTSLDFLKALQQESTLVFETEFMKEQLRRNPFEVDEKVVQSLAKTDLRVTDIQRTTTISSYSLINGVVQFPLPGGVASTKHPRQRNTTSVFFSYERLGEDSNKDGPTVFYFIDVSFDISQEKERLLWVQVWAEGHKPHGHVQAQNIMEGNDDADWDDIDSDDEPEVKRESKRSRRGSQGSPDDNKLGNDREPIEDENGQSCSGDRFAAVMDPEVVERLKHALNIESLDDQGVFYLLMTFPFYETEWDIIGFLMDSVFDSIDGSDV